VLYDRKQTTGGNTVKKAWLVIALTALGGMAANTFADVQNIRLSGDIRIRGYYLNDAGGTSSTSADVARDPIGNIVTPIAVTADGGDVYAPGTTVTPGTTSFDKQDGDATFISQRTRVCVEADLEDHVLVVVTLKAEGQWGSDNQNSTDAGAGSGNSDGSINRRWDVGVTEAYLQLNELFYSPATLKLGRQYLNYGRGLILSSAEQEYNFDAARLVLDFYPFTLDIVGAQVVNDQSFAANPSSAGSADLLFVNGRYEMNADNAKVNIEGYLGWLAQGTSSPKGISSRVPPSTGGASPIILGLRTDIAVPGFTMWAEGAYEFGSSGTGAAYNDISAWLFNAGAKVGSKDWKMSPSVNANYTYAGGGGKDGRHNFVPWFDYADGYNGYLFAPALANLHIFNVGASVKPAENVSLALQAYYYLKVDGDTAAGSNGNVDFGGLGFSSTQTAAREIGWELDTILGYDYSKDVRVQLVYGMFIPQGAYQNTPEVSEVAHAVRGEVNVKF